MVTLYFASAAYSIEQRATQSVSATQRAANPAKSDGLSQRSIIIVGGKKKPDGSSQRGIIIVSSKNKTVPARAAPNAAMDRLQGM
jgi:hypothetical protein